MKTEPGTPQPAPEEDKLPWHTHDEPTTSNVLTFLRREFPGADVAGVWDPRGFGFGQIVAITISDGPNAGDSAQRRAKQIALDHNARLRLSAMEPRAGSSAYDTGFNDCLYHLRTILASTTAEEKD